MGTFKLTTPVTLSHRVTGAYGLKTSDYHCVQIQHRISRNVTIQLAPRMDLTPAGLSQDLGQSDMLYSSNILSIASVAAPRSLGGRVNEVGRISTFSLLPK